MLTRKKIIVSGANGQLGQELGIISAKYPQYEFILLSRAELPIDDQEALHKIFTQHQPEYFINCAAYTAVDKAESEEVLAYAVNAAATGEIASACTEFGCRLIHISTDYVFDGAANSPYKPTSPTSPVSVYGSSKLKGEELAIKNNPETIIIRTSWVYSSFGKNFVKTMLRLMNERDEISVVNDQQGSPTYAADLAEACVLIIASDQWIPGIFHYSNEGVITWFDFAVAIRDLSGLSTKINPIPTSAYPTPAKRPAYAVLDQSLIRSAWNLPATPWKDRLATCLKRIQAS
jgi:dTDP-4-dehydrorhamnose reductase